MANAAAFEGVAFFAPTVAASSTNSVSFSLTSELRTRSTLSFPDRPPRSVDPAVPKSSNKARQWPVTSRAQVSVGTSDVDPVSEELSEEIAKNQAEFRQIVLETPIESHILAQ
jgi:hypothetical protein